MLFVEAELFTRFLPDYFSDDEYSEIQDFLVENPQAGVLIKGCHGLRKLRWKLSNKGKRGGVRIIYYWCVTDEIIYLMTLYAKNEAADLSSKDKKILKQLLGELK